MSGQRAPLERAEVTAKRIGDLLKNAMPKGWGFSLQLFTFGGPGFITYISNAKREDMKKALKELLDKWDREEQHV